MAVSETVKALQEMVANELARHCAEDSSDKEYRISWVDADDVKRIVDEVPKALRQLSDSYDLYFKGREKVEDERQKLECYKEAAELGNPIAMMSLASLYQNGVDVENISAAEHWYEQAASYGILEAMMELGDIYSSQGKRRQMKLSLGIWKHSKPDMKKLWAPLSGFAIKMKNMTKRMSGSRLPSRKTPRTKTRCISLA